jgi:hypothetical protein
MKAFGCSLIVCLLLSASAFAENRDFTLFGGVQNPGKLTLSGVPSAGGSGVTQIITDPARVGVFGARFGGGRVLGSETTLAYVPNFLDGNSRAVIMNSGLRLQIPSPLIRPYATAGLGTFFTWGSGVSDIGTKFAIVYGGGVKVMPGKAGVVFDIRGYTLPGVYDQTLNATEVSLGVVFGF